MPQFVIITGIGITLFGLLLLVLEHFGFPKLPGDIFFQKGNVTVYIPIVTMLVLSILLTVIINLFKK